MRTIIIRENTDLPIKHPLRFVVLSVDEDPLDAPDMEQRIQSRIDDMADADAEARANAEGWSYYDEQDLPF